MYFKNMTLGELTSFLQDLNKEQDGPVKFVLYSDGSGHFENARGEYLPSSSFESIVNLRYVIGPRFIEERNGIEIDRG